MLVALTREKFEQLVPLIASGDQYLHAWGKTETFLKRALISFLIVIAVFLLGFVLGEGFNSLELILEIVGGLYWFWSPVYAASVINSNYRRYPYSGFWRGEILDVYITEELVRTEETVDQQGRLMFVENRERRINIEVGDEVGFLTRIQAPLHRTYKALQPGEMVELVLLSNRPNLDRIGAISDAYVPRLNLWVGSYPMVRHDVFLEMRQRLLRRNWDGDRQRARN